jgi:predicted outer membrane repeat protein
MRNQIFLFWVCLFLAVPCSGEIIYVDDDGPADFNNIQAAINDSNDGDTIIVADGTYIGVGNREISFHGKAITVRSENGPEKSIIDCQGKGMGFLFRDGEGANSILAGLTIRNGYSSGCGALAITSYSSPMIINCTFENNHGDHGGAISCHSYYSPKLTNCIFTGNSSHYGGGIFISEGSPILTNCKFSGNSAVDYGGAVHCEETSSPTFRNCLIIGNKTEWNGGGISNTDGSDAIIENCTITDNIANGKGGGIYSPDRMTISNSILWGNYPDQITQNYRIVINYSDVEGGWSDVGNFDEDPCFVDPGYWDANGLWVEGDYHLLWDSPCINAGDPDYVSGPNETDLDGRPRVIAGRIDMGAYECSLIAAEARIIPHNINLTSKGKWIVCYIWLPEGYDVADIDFHSLLLEFLDKEIEPVQFWVNEKQQVAMARFSREDLRGILNGGDMELTITGQLNDGTSFEATDIIRVIDKGKIK